MGTTEKLSLLELNQRIKAYLQGSFPDYYWITAEISEIKESSTGHCYLELVQKDEFASRIVAKNRATIWSDTYRMLKPYFQTATQRQLSAGLKVLVMVDLAFHEVYGLSLRIVDIEPSYTIGEIELKRRETIQRLENEGVINMNKELSMPLLPKRVAVISSDKAAGYQDFVNQITDNPYGYSIELTLFPAVMQGTQAEASIVNALNQVYEQQENFDTVAIIRGGGSQSDLACFDEYWVAANIAQFPLPVITGIGHEKDTSVADMVAHQRLKTPTAAAEFIITKFNEAEATAINLKELFVDIVESAIASNKQKLQEIKIVLPAHVYDKTRLSAIQFEKLKAKAISLTTLAVQREKFGLQKKSKSLSQQVTNQINKEKERVRNHSFALKKESIKSVNTAIRKIDAHERNLEALNPENVLKRGYSITYSGKTLIKSKDQVETGTEVTTILYNGEISSRVI
ncbi:MAG: exodeoxyribonuclease VII large subunit [Bacteroidales bacterium]|nr:exodeoxyribonuclease VII large subunit [Bacteroidales bacterium]MBN2750165.1 exodeoxyribonuclease VII large subunit [Bacteroidales bacterium]